MNPIDYCRDQLKKQGTSLYYALLICPTSCKDQVVALLALHKELQSTLFKTHEYSVAQLKLSWWKSELELGFQDQATHPITQALNAYTGPHRLRDCPDLSLPLLTNMVEGVEQCVQQNRHLDEKAFEKTAQLCAGSLTQLLAYTLTGQTVNDFSQAYGLGMAYATLVRDMGFMASQGHLFVPMSDLRRFHLTAQQIFSLKPCDEVAQLVNHESQKALQHLNQALLLAKQTKGANKALNPLLAMAHSSMALVKQLQKKPDLALQQRYHLSPLRKAWISYRQSWR